MLSSPLFKTTTRTLISTKRSIWAVRVLSHDVRLILSSNIRHRFLICLPLQRHQISTTANFTCMDTPQKIELPSAYMNNSKDDIVSQPVVSVETPATCIPALAVTFLDEFIGLLSERSSEQETYPDHLIPYVHCYVFGKAEDTRQAARELAEENLGESLPEDATVRFVRNVAPNKDMYCVAFKVPRHLLFRTDGKSTESQQTADDEPPEKRHKPNEEQ